jgi:general secretion pathway protein M
MSTLRQRLSPRGQRIFAIAILVVVVMLPVAAIAALAWVGHRHYDDAIFKTTRQLKSQSAANAARPQLLETVELLKGKDIKKYFLKGSTPALAGAELQELVKAIAEQNSGRVLSVQTLPHKDVDGYRQLSASLQVSVSVPNLRAILYALESREPYVFVDGLKVTSQAGFGFKPAPGAPEVEHFVQIDVSGIAPLVVADPVNAGGSPATPSKAGAGAGPKSTGGKT